MLWPFAVKAAIEILNFLQLYLDGNTPTAKFYNINNICSEKLPLQSYLEMLGSKTECFGLLGNNIILVIILLDLIER